MAAQVIRQDVCSDRITLQTGHLMIGELHRRAQRNITIALRINKKIGTRGAEFDTVIEAVSPGVKQEVAAHAAAPAVPLRPRAPVALRLRPEPTAPEIGRIAANEPVTVKPATGNFALVETATGLRGYAPAASSPGRRPTTTNAVGITGDGGSHELAATNIAWRDNLTDSVSDAERTMQGQGFELAS